MTPEHILFGFVVIVLTLNQMQQAQLKAQKAQIAGLERQMARLSERLGLPPLPLEERVCDLLAQGAKIEAVKLYREETRVDLARAKTAVEAIGRAKPTSPVA